MKFTANKLSTLVAITFTANIFSFSAFADQPYQGHRIGVGISSGKMDSFYFEGDSDDIGSGLKLEYGYDINRIFGLNVSLDKNKDDEDSWLGKYESDVTALKVDADIGYAFEFNDFTLKPYGAIGFARIKDKTSFTPAVGDKEFYSSNEGALLLGTGVRVSFDFGLYADLRSNYMILEHYDMDQLSLTIGYKF